MQENRVLLNNAQAAEFLQISENTLRVWVSRGKVPYTKIGKRLVRYRKGDLEDWIDGQTHHPGLQECT